LCLPACPTDAIVGSNKRMHTVIEPDCTGCELCVAVCPVDCISLENVTGERTGWQAWTAAQAERALRRYELHRSRVHVPADASEPEGDEAARKRAVIAAALARSRAKRDG
jgi:electron transport complex protein RnfB